MIREINTNSNKQPSFKGMYNNKMLLKSLKFASENSSLFSATTALTLSAIRPVSILLTPKTDKKNKQIACTKSLASSAVGYMLMLAASLPVAHAVKHIDKTPSEFLKKSTIKSLQNNADKLTNSKRYMFATQLFKLGIGLLLAVPKSALTCALIPPVFNKIFKDTDKKQTLMPEQRHYQKSNSSIISFKGMYTQITKTMAKGMGKIIDTNPIKKASEKFCETNFAQHIMNFTDILLTYAFVKQTQKSKDIKEDRKKALIHNSIISTGLCITGGYAVNKALNKPTEKFINNFKEANKNLPELEKYVEGIRIAKPALILGGIYYIAIPLISTFFADRTSKYSHLINQKSKK